MTNEEKALGVRHAKITGKDMRDHWGPIVDRIADEISDPRDAIIETQAREIERLREAIAWKDAALRKIRDGAYLKPTHVQRIANEALEGKQ